MGQGCGFVIDGLLAFEGWGSIGSGGFEREDATREAASLREDATREAASQAPGPREDAIPGACASAVTCETGPYKAPPAKRALLRPSSLTPLKTSFGFVRKSTVDWR